MPQFYPVNASSIQSSERLITNEHQQDFNVFKKNGKLCGNYCLLLEAVFTELFELKYFPYDVQDLSMDMEYMNYSKADYECDSLPDDPRGDIDLDNSSVRVYEKCLNSPEWRFHSVQMGFGNTKEEIRINVKL